jgi:hypothetical protein
MRMPVMMVLMIVVMMMGVACHLDRQPDRTADELAEVR